MEMADAAQLEVLRSGVSVWNRWRFDHPTIRPNLRGADLQGMDLAGASLHDAYLLGADLSRAYLFEADFQAANLRGANLSRCCLIGANLHNAYLAEANLYHAYLAETDLSDAYLGQANLREADLQKAILTATFWGQADLWKADFSGAYEIAPLSLRSAHNLEFAVLDDTLRAQLGLPEPPASPDNSSPAPPGPLEQTNDRDSTLIPDSR